MSLPEGTIIRQAHVEDIPTILHLIHALATYEKEPPTSIEATPEKLLKTIAFSPSPSSPSPSPSTPNISGITPNRPARCLLLFPAGEKEAVAFAVYYYTYSTWRALPGIHLEDLFVVPEWRGMGFGRALLGELAREVGGMGGGRLEWNVLKWNEPSIKFYKGESVGAEMLEEWVGMRVDGEKLEKLAGKGIDSR
ncbi:hypothetical protein HYALB_00001867 [Hymenoscyphus albidus]|uniref:N-acetyltransferase domain-containing protein n=1 Tax=Hymenoscyphus albidus TaxID=595503 RepID=A0A9N9Q364_9HELO|nr:hypothetical protein HYALB_00001867 [Hymenoscyphus albidus]